MDESETISAVKPSPADQIISTDKTSRDAQPLNDAEPNGGENASSIEASTVESSSNRQVTDNDPSAVDKTNDTETTPSEQTTDVDAIDGSSTIEQPANDHVSTYAPSTVHPEEPAIAEQTTETSGITKPAIETNVQQSDDASAALPVAQVDVDILPSTHHIVMDDVGDGVDESDNSVDEERNAIDDGELSEDGAEESNEDDEEEYEDEDAIINDLDDRVSDPEEYDSDNDDDHIADLILPDRPQQAARVGKKRRRILALDSADEDSSNDEEAEDQHRSPTEFDEPIEEDVVDETAYDDYDSLSNERLEELVKNEKPGPKSKKASTQLLAEIQARALLQSAVVVPVAAAPTDAKKRKMRILESEDEEEEDSLEAARQQLAGAVADSVADIGAEPDAIDLDTEPADGIVIATVDPENENADMNTAPILDEIKIEPLDEAEPDADLSQNLLMALGMSLDDDGTTNSGASTSKAAKASKVSTDVVRKEPKPSPAKQKKRRSLYSSSEEGDDYLPNDVYFGTPDRADLVRQARGRGRGRGRGSSSTTGTRGRGRGRGRPPGGQKSKSYRQHYESDNSSSEESCSSDSDSRRRQRQHSKAIQQKSSRSVDPLGDPLRDSGPPAKSGKRRKEARRLRDKSRKIPNDVYFDAKVPLDVLYAYGTESSEEDMPPFPPISSITGRPFKQHTANPRGRGSGRGRGRGSRGGASTSTKKAPVRPRSPSVSPPTVASKRGRKPGHSTSNADIRLKHMKKCFRAAGFRKHRLKELLRNCDSPMERADAIVQLLRENGLEGAPTVDNCASMRKAVVCKEEARELDTSLILQVEGRTRRSAAVAKTAAAADPASAKAVESSDGDGESANPSLRKIKKLIDSESDEDEGKKPDDSAIGTSNKSNQEQSPEGSTSQQVAETTNNVPPAQQQQLEQIEPPKPIEPVSNAQPQQSDPNITQQHDDTPLNAEQPLEQQQDQIVSQQQQQKLDFLQQIDGQTFNVHRPQQQQLEQIVSTPQLGEAVAINVQQPQQQQTDLTMLQPFSDHQPQQQHHHHLNASIIQPLHGTTLNAQQQQQHVSHSSFDATAFNVQQPQQNIMQPLTDTMIGYQQEQHGQQPAHHVLQSLDESTINMQPLHQQQQHATIANAPVAIDDIDSITATLVTEAMNI